MPTSDGRAQGMTAVIMIDGRRDLGAITPLPPVALEYKPARALEGTRGLIGTLYSHGSFFLFPFDRDAQRNQEWGHERLSGIGKITYPLFYSENLWE